jgi:hypothetical protein
MEQIPRKGTRVRLIHLEGEPAGTVAGGREDHDLPDALVAGASVLVDLDEPDPMGNPVRVHIEHLVPE